jgi:hypothetical protein
MDSGGAGVERRHVEEGRGGVRYGALALEQGPPGSGRQGARPAAAPHYRARWRQGRLVVGHGGNLRERGTRGAWADPGKGKMARPKGIIWFFIYSSFFKLI